MSSDDEFESFHLAGYPRLVGRLTVLTGSLEDAEDAVQEAFARASTRWGRLRDYDAPEAWVRRVALNPATSGLRRARRQLPALARLHAPANQPARSTDRLTIQAGLARLPLRYRQVLVLFYDADSHMLPGLDDQAAGAVARLILGAGEPEPHKQERTARAGASR